MNEVETVKPAPPIQITEDIQVSLNRLGRDLETHAESGIRIGKELIYLKEITPYGQFGELVEWAYGLTEWQRTNYMNTARKYTDQTCACAQFSNRVLIELSRPSTPESAREEAAEHDKLTVKQSKELVKAHKDLDELKTKYDELQKCETPKEIKPDLTRLIPRIKAMSDNEDIMPAMAKKISCMPNSVQESWLSSYIQKQSLENQKQSLENQLAAQKQKVVDLEARPEPKPTIIEKEVIPLGVQAKLKEAKTALADKNKAEKAKREANEKASGARKANTEFKLEIKKLKEELGVNNPTNVDLAMEKKIRGLIDGVQFAIRELQGDMLNMGGGSMERSIIALEDLNEGITLSVAALKGDSKQMIKTTGV